MNKIGILTFHYSNNYGGVLQCYALYSVLKNMGHNVEIINYVPSDYNENKIISSLGLSKSRKINIVEFIKKINIKIKYNKKISSNFNKFRKDNMKISKLVDENTIMNILSEYDTIIVGSDQIWNPSQREKKEYFLDFEGEFLGRKISYAADSTIKDIDIDHVEKIKNSLENFNFISVRNKHSYEFAKALTSKEISIVSDPTILYDFTKEVLNSELKESYILTYILGNEIDGSHERTLNKIKKVYGDLPVYSIVIPTMEFKINDFADKVFYDLGPKEWLTMFKNATFIYTDSYHGVLFSLKYNIPFLAYYTELFRSTRFIDLAERYDIDKFIISSIDEIDKKKSLDKSDLSKTKKIIKNHKEYSIKFLEKSLYQQ